MSDDLGIDLEFCSRCFRIALRGLGAPGLEGHVCSPVKETVKMDADQSAVVIIREDGTGSVFLDTLDDYVSLRFDRARLTKLADKVRDAIRKNDGSITEWGTP